MFKFIHCADLHLDSPLRGLTEKPDAPVEEIRQASRRALGNLVNLALEENVQFVLIAGDVYDGDWQDYSTGLFFNAQMNRLKEKNIPVYFIRGNHDAASVITHRLVLPDNVFEFSVDQPETRLIEGLQVAIHGQGYKQRDVWENLSLHYPDPVPGYFNIGLLHTSLEGQEGHASYAPAKADELIQKGYDYWALGHIHKRQIILENPYIVYPGNIQGRHIKETGNKGCTLVTVDGDTVTIEHRSLDVLRFYECEVDLTGIEDDYDLSATVEEKLVDLVQANPGIPLAVRVILTGSTSLHREFLNDEERYFNEIVNAANMASDQIWIEKVKFHTTLPKGQTIFTEQNDALSKLLNDDRLHDEEFLNELLASIKKVQKKLGPYLKQEDALVIESIDDLKPVVEDARDVLLGSLLKGGS